eukprot:GHVS01062854.1.p1 GENE.GHVS01062854.1~~GHVS01062854.1.p1  ORF type:complete len:272 (-),score=85.84 GHVS01062854.1:75-791(-)
MGVSCVTDVCGSSGGGVLVSLKVVRGRHRCGEKVVIWPGRFVGLWKCFGVRGRQQVDVCEGEYVEAAVIGGGVDPSEVMVGAVVTGEHVDVAQPGCKRSVVRKSCCGVGEPRMMYLSSSKLVRAQIMVFESPLPIVKGLQVVCHLHTYVCMSTVAKIEEVIDKTKQTVDGAPRTSCKALSVGMLAIVQLALPVEVCVDLREKDFVDFRSLPPGEVSILSRVVLRHRSVSIAAGVAIAG